MQREKEFIFYILVLHVMQSAKKAKRNDGRKKLPYSISYKEHVATCNSRA